ncbi:MAG TPA: four helix bundle protein [Thermoanaerobaculia bacterium]|jgi:four helix bundle protein|nr:four helix bundle protein [Thermoanaerobaculia bacterium]
MGNYRNLRAWKEAMDLVAAVYASVGSFPKSEIFYLSAQMRSAALSIPFNLAEGCGRHTIRDQQHFYRQARGSVYELQTAIDVARRQQFVTEQVGQDLKARADEVGRLVNALLNSLKPTTND